MSYVSDVVLLADAQDLDDVPDIGLKQIDRYAGGGKCMSDLFAAGVNFLDSEQLIAWFHSKSFSKSSVMIIHTEQNPPEVFVYRSGND